uniref:FAR1 domain-containing protein n=1 Tax=Lactuca sativa TaxID=4236 RepID=A0A9R1X9R0_LACSA|nr:hypothetical protein LSAT_V11C500251560 [Lactuca sativa]
MSNSSVIDGDLYSSMCESEQEDVENLFFEGLIFKSLKLAIKMYSEYAEIGGFDVRLSAQSRFDNKIIKKKHVICNHGGKQKKEIL